MKTRPRAILPLLSAAMAASALADARPNGIFSSHAVLQRGRPVPVWGTADPGEEVSVRFAGGELRTAADAAGRWEAALPAMEWSAEPRDLVVAGRTNEVVLSDVLVGDVWLVGGQSNAEMAIGGSWGVGGAAQAEAEAKAAAFPNIRHVKFRREKALFPQDGEPCCGAWKVADSNAVAGITAMGYYFVRELNAKTGIPMGILDDNWSGCPIEPFVNDAGIAAVPDIAARETGPLSRTRAEWVEWAQRMAAATASGGGYGDVGKMPEGSNWTRMYNAMVAPIAKFPIAGATWYQGCSNGGEGEGYAKKLEALAAGWRAAWGYRFPFYIVQLASYTAKTTDPAGGNGYARVRNAQRIALQTIPLCGLAVTIDIGNATNIHPKNKLDVGLRLARWALRDVYGDKDVVVSGPLYNSMGVEGSAIRIVFDHAGSGLVAAEKDPDAGGVPAVETPGAELRGFAIAGADRRWVWAKARIDGGTVVVSSDQVPKPVAVRYAHRANPMGDCNLYNKEGLPASPFRTDDW
ncbi:MAG: sialate O-acetylesterase [Kiritimatiellae bacterium]|nr:sialate O-acetylesterase [Kiritimatiellia bacterium]